MTTMSLNRTLVLLFPLRSLGLGAARMRLTAWVVWGAWGALFLGSSSRVLPPAPHQALLDPFTLDCVLVAPGTLPAALSQPSYKAAHDFYSRQVAVFLALFVYLPLLVILLCNLVILRVTLAPPPASLLLGRQQGRADRPAGA